MSLFKEKIVVDEEISVLKMLKNDWIQFEWKMSDSPDEPILLTIDASTSVVPDSSGGLIGIFDCCQFSTLSLFKSDSICLASHHCVKVEPFFRQHFHTFETFLLRIPQHGLYSFAYSDNRDDVLLNVIVENTEDVSERDLFSSLLFSSSLLLI